MPLSPEPLSGKDAAPLYNEGVYSSAAMEYVGGTQPMEPQRSTTRATELVCNVDGFTCCGSAACGTAGEDDAVCVSSGSEIPGITVLTTDGRSSDERGAAAGKPRDSHDS